MIKLNESRQALYSLAHTLVNNGKEQNALVECFKEIEKDTISDKQALTDMVGVLYDGLAYGNWPWIRNGVNTLLED